MLQKVDNKCKALLRLGYFLKPVEPSLDSASVRQSTVELVHPVAKPTARVAASVKPVKRVKYPLRKHFTWSVCFKLAQKYKLAVYQNPEATPEDKSRAVQAIFYHEQDYPLSTIAEKKEFHQFCGSWCKYKCWENEKKPLEEFFRLGKDKNGNTVAWEGGLLRRTVIPAEAYNDLFQVFERIGNVTLMARCKRIITQNINESVHSRLWRHCLKIKRHGWARYMFCARHVMLVHNFGHFSSSLNHVLGTMTPAMEKTLKYDDKVMHQTAQRKHELKDGGIKSYRIKKRVPLQKNRQTCYEPGCEPIISQWGIIMTSGRKATFIE